MSDTPTHSVPSWVWLFTGVATGLFLAFLYYLAGIQTPTDSINKPSVQSQRSATTNSSDSPSFDFYNLLPEANVSVPRAKIRPTATPITAKEIILQTGAFTLPADADRRRAELLLLGLNASIEKANVKGRTFHRVHVGPFSPSQPLSQAKSLLNQSGIEYIQKSTR